MRKGRQAAKPPACLKARLPPGWQKICSPPSTDKPAKIFIKGKRPNFFFLKGIKFLRA